MPATLLPADLRLILAHKQKTSARLRFLRLPAGICAFAPLPALAVLKEVDEGDPAIAHHPSAWLRATEQHLGLAPGSLRPEPEFRATVQTPAGPVAVQLVELTTIDPPFEAAAAAGGRFIAITEARDCTAVELELLRRAYSVLIG